MKKLEILERLATRLEDTMEIKAYKDFIKEWVDNELMNDFVIAQTESLVVKYDRREERLIFETTFSNLEITEEIIDQIHNMNVNVNIARIQLDQLKEKKEEKEWLREVMSKGGEEVIFDDDEEPKLSGHWIDDEDIDEHFDDDDSITRFKTDAHIDDNLIEKETVREKMDKKVKENAKKNLKNEKLVKQIFKGNYKNYFNNGKRVKRYIIDSYKLELFYKNAVTSIIFPNLDALITSVIPVNKEFKQNLAFIDEKRNMRYLVKNEDIKNMNLKSNEEVKVKYELFEI